MLFTLANLISHLRCCKSNTAAFEVVCTQNKHAHIFLTTKILEEKCACVFASSTLQPLTFPSHLSFCAQQYLKTKRHRRLLTFFLHKHCCRVVCVCSCVTHTFTLARQQPLFIAKSESDIFLSHFPTMSTFGGPQKCVCVCDWNLRNGTLDWLCVCVQTATNTSVKEWPECVCAFVWCVNQKLVYREISEAGRRGGRKRKWKSNRGRGSPLSLSLSTVIIAMPATVMHYCQVAQIDTYLGANVVIIVTFNKTTYILLNLKLHLVQMRLLLLYRRLIGRTNKIWQVITNVAEYVCALNQSTV